MMNLFEAVKDAIPTRTAAEHYGIEVKRNGMACCPFHRGGTVISAAPAMEYYVSKLPRN